MTKGLASGAANANAIRPAMGDTTDPAMTMSEASSISEVDPLITAATINAPSASPSTVTRAAAAGEPSSGAETLEPRVSRSRPLSSGRPSSRLDPVIAHGCRGRLLVRSVTINLPRVQGNR